MSVVTAMPADHVSGLPSPPTGGESPRTPKTYDFRLPETLDRSQLRWLRLMFDAFAHRISGVLTSRLRAPVSVALGEFDQQSWDDYSNALPEVTCLVGVTLQPLPGRVTMHLPLPLAMVIVDLRLGGTGKGVFPGRALTEIEQRLIGEVAQGIMEELPAVFQPVIPLQVSSLSQVGSVQLLPAIRSTDMCLVSALSLELGDGLQFPLSVCFPFSVIHPILDVLRNREIDEAPTERSGTEEAVVSRILQTAVEARVQFPTTSLTPAEFLHLSVGDVVRLPYEQGASLSLTVGGQHQLDVLPTVHGKRLACIVIDHEETQP